MREIMEGLSAATIARLRMDAARPVRDALELRALDLIGDKELLAVVASASEINSSLPAGRDADPRQAAAMRRFDEMLRSSLAAEMK